jgi:hypothetical protein
MALTLSACSACSGSSHFAVVGDAGPGDAGADVTDAHVSVTDTGAHAADTGVDRVDTGVNAVDTGADRGDVACRLVTGQTYYSDGMSECGVGGAPGSVSTCNWQISFDAVAHTYSWRHSDVVDSQPYTCQGLSVDSVDGLHHGSIDPTSGALTWGGMSYSLR